MAHPSSRQRERWPRTGGSIPWLPPRAFGVDGGECVELRAAVVFRRLPLGLDPASLLELVQRGIERAVADVERVFGHLLQAVANGPPELATTREMAADRRLHSLASAASFRRRWR